MPSRRHPRPSAADLATFVLPALPVDSTLYPMSSPWQGVVCREGASLRDLAAWETDGGALPYLSVYPCEETLEAPSAHHSDDDIDYR